MARSGLLALTEAIYDAAAGDTPWPVVERGLRSLMQAGTATLLTGDYATGRIELLWREGFSDSDIALYQGTTATWTCGPRARPPRPPPPPPAPTAPSRC